MNRIDVSSLFLPGSDFDSAYPSNGEQADRQARAGSYNSLPMVGRGNAVSEAVARNVHEMRTLRGWSLDLLARRSGVSKGLLVQIEQGHGNPSLITMVRLSDAFGITVAQLIQGDRPSEVKLVREGEAVVLWSDERGSKAELLLGLDRREHVELWRWLLMPGASQGSEAHLRGTQEMISVTAGELTLEVGDETHRLGIGDSVLYPSDRDHSYRNEGSIPVRFQMVVIMPAASDERS
jgi:transcriptional regulator with XRE-family HTH domain